jgi:hypothetical protein
MTWHQWPSRTRVADTLRVFRRSALSESRVGGPGGRSCTGSRLGGGGSGERGGTSNKANKIRDLYGRTLKISTFQNSKYTVKKIV